MVKYDCLDPVIIPSIDNDKEWQNLRKIEGEVWKGAFNFAFEECGSEIITDGLDAFRLGADSIETVFDEEHLFPGWFIFRWVPSTSSKKWKHLGHNVTLADLYTHRNELQTYVPFLSAVNQSPFSFFLVEDVIPSRRLILKDLFLDRTIAIKEKMGATAKMKGAIVFARLISYEGQAIQIGLGPTPLPSQYISVVLDLKQFILKQEKSLTSTEPIRI